MSVVFELLKKEKKRQANTVELIASENFVSKNILKALGSCFTNKYTEGYPPGEYRTTGSKGRYYGGCEYYDQLEQYCCTKWQEVFDTDYHVNVQPHSGSQANMAAYTAVLKPGDRILSMSLENGGHLTHGSPVNFSGKLYEVEHYGVNEDGYIDYKDLETKMREFKPNLILAGASAYSRKIDFEKIRAIINRVSSESGEVEVVGNYAYPVMTYNPIFMVDMSHIAGLVATGYHPSPFRYADIITTTTHKTLRGPRGGLIFCKPELAKAVDSAIFPGIQGGSLQNVIAAKAIAAEEACSPKFSAYIGCVVSNAECMAKAFSDMGYDVVTGGTDNHMFLIDFSRTHPNLTGKMVQDRLDEYGITVNKNCVPNEKRSPSQTSGIRIGTPAMTTKGYTGNEFIRVAKRIDKIIKEM